ncbi:MAG TPA: hypothetical protein VIP98_19605 [Microlunatus sp.]
MKATDEAIRAQVDQARTDRESPSDAVRAVAETIAEGIRSKGFRGCAFLNAAAEYPAAKHPVHRAVLHHRQWFLDTVTEMLAGVGASAPDADARHFIMLRDGAMAAGCLTADPESTCQTFLLGVEAILARRESPIGKNARRARSKPRS